MTAVAYRKITGDGGDAAAIRRRLPNGERTVAGCGGSGERPTEMEARGIHARFFLLRVWARRGGSSAETPATDSSQRHEHIGGLEIARNPTVREISTIY